MYAIEVNDAKSQNSSQPFHANRRKTVVYKTRPHKKHSTSMNTWEIFSSKCPEIGKSHENRTENLKDNISRGKAGQTRISITVNKLYNKTAKAYSRRGFKWRL